MSRLRGTVCCVEIEMDVAPFPFEFFCDMQEIINLIESTPNHDAKALRKLELLVAKVEALQKEDYETLESIRREIKGLP